MTDEKIMKALECHKEADLDTCTICPLLNTQDCAYKLSGYALDLINRQKAEIERLKERDETAEKIIREQGGTILRLKNEVERYSEKAKSFENAAKNTFLEKVRVDFNPLAEAKAEAIKEFAERLHCHCESIINEPWNEKVYPISWAYAYEEFEDVVENLVKEMVGDTE